MAGPDKDRVFKEHASTHPHTNSSNSRDTSFSGHVTGFRCSHCWIHLCKDLDIHAFDVRHKRLATTQNRGISVYGLAKSAAFARRFHGESPVDWTAIPRPSHLPMPPKRN
ncbi:hypothetical protein M409DRAFT_60412 [Zasmidium cellare ATCC 36951]|uniref:Uncharacterized protein n=1 Tax=Zasmidium cellare ATCC 36951 TaxID=1080233 RepID=A0A6A6C2D2_ZASCE|nr:uncharacterized protein M409DRAFT_60412 [Zasmidium cellare ATCC 36951]KAF2160012.1 hypothetical protein M409DRAFT_60412 [Zasmidium cellare ATCC 36951]